MKGEETNTKTDRRRVERDKHKDRQTKGRETNTRRDRRRMERQTQRQIDEGHGDKHKDR